MKEEDQDLFRKVVVAIFNKLPTKVKAIGAAIAGGALAWFIFMAYEGGF